MFRLLVLLAATLAVLPLQGLADEESVSAAIDAFHDAASRADSDTYFGLMTDDVVFLGTDGTERWQGDEFREFVDGYFSRGQGWTYVPTDRHIDMGVSGEWALFDELLQHERLGQCRGSGVLVREKSGWKIAQYNLSVPIPNAIVVDVAGQIRGAATTSDQP